MDILDIIFNFSFAFSVAVAIGFIFWQYRVYLENLNYYFPVQAVSFLAFTSLFSYNIGNRSEPGKIS